MLEQLEERLREAGRGRVALIGFPSDEHSSFLRGAAEAPPLIREALHSYATNLWTEDGLDLGSGAPILEAGDYEEGIEQAVALLLHHGHAPLALGGDHAITFPIVTAFAAKYDPLDLLLFDAHPDLYDELDGSRSSHACPFARIMERGLVRRLVQVGVRTMNGHQREQAEKFGVEVIEMKHLDPGRAFAFDAPLYVSIDLDVLDPAFAPGVSHREPGGMSTRQLIEAIQEIRARIVGADVVEFNPRQDPVGITAPVCAKLVKELAARLHGIEERGDPLE
jgi:agmatinase